MTKSIFIISALLLLVSCNSETCPTKDKPASTSKVQSEDEKPLAETSNCTPTETPGEVKPPEEPSPEEPGEEVPPSEDVPAEAYLFDANVSLFEFDAKDETKVTKAIEIIKKVIRTKEFKDRVIDFTYKGKKTFVDSAGKTNAEIYQSLLDGSEELRPGIDHQMDLELELYYSSRSTVGYTYASGLRIWMNTKFFDAYTPSEVAGNVFHEWTHKLGYDHASSYSVARDSSVPYALGYLIEELGKKFE